MSEKNKKAESPAEALGLARPKPRGDFVRVTLSDAGRAAGGARIVGPTYDFDFTGPHAERAIEMPRAEYSARLASEKLGEENLFVAEECEPA